MRCAANICVLALLTVTASAAGDETCDRLKGFELAAKPTVGKASARDWIEMRWMANPPNDEIFHMECHHSESKASAELCGWLVKNSSWEFHNFLPMRILGCHGAKFPDHFEYSDVWIASIRLEPEKFEGRWMVLDIAIGGHKGDSVIRYSVFIGDKAEKENPLPPLFPPQEFLGVGN